MLPLAERDDYTAFMLIAGIDHGAVRIGIALADTSVGIASPYQIYHRRGPANDEHFFRQLVTEEQIEKFVIGLPVHLNGAESQQSTAAREFGKWLCGVSGLPIEFFDERFSTAEAERILQSAQLTTKQRKARRDQLAAQIMLTAYLEAGARNDDRPGGID